MPEDKREQVRLASDGMLGRVPPPPKPDIELEIARDRARLSVLALTDKDKRFLRALKITV